jgi:fructose-1-phosphate kinase PfkB-like protein
MLGTHWVGLHHGISHFSLAKQTVSEGATVASISTTAHSSDVCHLFDALTLAGCIPPSFSSAPLAKYAQPIIHQGKAVQVDATSLIAYQSQAPPSLIL